MTDEFRAELAALHLKADLTLRTLLHLLTRHPDMAIHDDILNALSANDAALVAVGAKADNLITDYSAGAAAFSDVLPRVTAQGSAIAALDAKLSGALPDAVAAAPAPSDASAAPAPSAPAAPAATAAPSTEATPVVGLTFPAAVAPTA